MSDNDTRAMTEDGKFIYVIPSMNLPAFDEKIKKLARRAKRLGVPEPTYVELSVEKAEHKFRNDDGKTYVETYLKHTIAIDPGISTVKVAGWVFKATIQHTEEGNILRSVPGSDGENLPKEYRTVTQRCEHCNIDRNRKDTFILYHEVDGIYKQVGRTCLHDFLGVDGLKYAEQAQYIIDLSDIGEASESWGGGGTGPRYDDLEVYLAAVTELIKVDGWMSRKRSRELGTLSTADCAIDILHPRPQDKPFPISDESKEFAKKSIVWAEEIDGEDISDYLHNIRLIAKRGVVGGREYGLAASIVPAYQRYLGDIHKAELRAKRSEIAKYVGSVGDREVFKLFVEKVLRFENDYSRFGGVTHLHIMSDPYGNVFTWMASSGALDTGVEVLLKGTIKEHKEYKGVKQNILTRCEKIELKKFFTEVNGVRFSEEAENENAFKKLVKEFTGLARLPRGMKIIEEKPDVIKEMDNLDFTVPV